MLYNCPNGTTLNMTTELYFTISDRQLDEMCRCNFWDEVQDPFFESTIEPPKFYLLDGLDVLDD